MDDLLMWRGYDTLAIDFNDPMSHADPSSLSDSPSHEAADLPEANTRLHSGQATSSNRVGVKGCPPWALVLYCEHPLGADSARLGPFKSLRFFL